MPGEGGGGSKGVQLGVAIYAICSKGGGRVGGGVLRRSFWGLLSTLSCSKRGDAIML